MRRTRDRHCGHVWCCQRALERSESDSSARIEVSILRKISIGTVQIFQYRYLSKYRYFDNTNPQYTVLHILSHCTFYFLFIYFIICSYFNFILTCIYILCVLCFIVLFFISFALSIERTCPDLHFTSDYTLYDCVVTNIKNPEPWKGVYYWVYNYKLYRFLCLLKITILNYTEKMYNLFELCLNKNNNFES